MRIAHRIGQAKWALGSVLLLVPAVVFGQGWAVGRANAELSDLPSGSIYNIIKTTMNWLLGILGFIAIIGFVIAGILYLTSAGDETQIERAKEAMKYSIIGVVVALMGLVVIQAVDIWLFGNTTAF